MNTPMLAQIPGSFRRNGGVQIFNGWCGDPNTGGTTVKPGCALPDEPPPRKAYNLVVSESKTGVGGYPVVSVGCPDRSCTVQVIEYSGVRMTAPPVPVEPAIAWGLVFNVFLVGLCCGFGVGACWTIWMTRTGR